MAKIILHFVFFILCVFMIGVYTSAERCCGYDIPFWRWGLTYLLMFIFGYKGMKDLAEYLKK